MNLEVANLMGAQLPFRQLLRQSSNWTRRVLGFIRFSGTKEAEESLRDIPSIGVRAQPLLGADESFCEVWRTASSLSGGRYGEIQYRHSDDLLFGCIGMAESRFADGAGNDPESTPLRRAAEFVYREIFAVLDALDYPHLLRVWNYFSDINRESNGMERYRQFNIGRQEGFLGGGRALTGNVPAACTLGSMSGPLSVCFLAGRAAPLPIENPRQVSAYHYPRQYGPRSPTFSRAALARIGGQEVLFVSGTASIVGHQSLHLDDAAAQTRETLTNLQAIFQEANRLTAQSHFELREAYFKVYVRYPGDAAAVREELIRFLGGPVRAVFLRADICRRELLVEIEATAGHFSEPSS